MFTATRPVRGLTSRNQVQGSENLCNNCFKRAHPMETFLSRSKRGSALWGRVRYHDGLPIDLFYLYTTKDLLQSLNSPPPPRIWILLVITSLERTKYSENSSVSPSLTSCAECQIAYLRVSWLHNCVIIVYIQAFLIVSSWLHVVVQHIACCCAN